MAPDGGGDESVIGYVVPGGNTQGCGLGLSKAGSSQHQFALICRNPRLGLERTPSAPSLQILCSEKLRECGSRDIKCIRPQTKNPEAIRDSVYSAVAKVPFSGSYEALVHACSWVGQQALCSSRPMLAYVPEELSL